MKICVLGPIKGAYRVKTIVGALINSGYEICLCDIKYDATKRKSSFYIKKLCYYVSSVLGIITSDVVYISPFAHNTRMIYIARLLSKKIITDFYVSLYDMEVLDKKNVAMNSYKAKKLLKKDLYALRNSTLVFFLNDAEARYYTKVVGTDFSNTNMAILPLGISAKENVKLDYFKKKRDCLNICWVGTYIPLQGLDIILKAIAILKKADKIKFHLYIWGDSEKKGRKYLSMINELNIQDVVSVHNEWGNFEAFSAHMIEKCDVNLGIFGDSQKAKTVLANKVIDGMAFKAPVITAYSDGVCNYFKDGENIILCKNTAESLASAIVRVAEMDLEQVNEIVKSAYSIYISTFSEKALERSFLSYLRNIGAK